MNPGDARRLVADHLTAAGLTVLHTPITVDLQTPPCAVVAPAEWANAWETACGHGAWTVRVELVAGDPAGVADPAGLTDVADDLFQTAWTALRATATLNGSAVDVVAGRWLARNMTVEVMA